LVPCMIHQIVVALCTFDDFKTKREGSSNGTPIVQSGNSAVLALFKADCIPIIYQIVLQCNNDERICTKDETLVSAFLALRAMAIQDDVVQSMNDIGVIDIAVKVLTDVVAESNNRSIEYCHLTTAIIGLLRNASANDDLKTSLCFRGKSMTVVQSTLDAMDLYKTKAVLQEHACGLFAAMALRKPKNAVALCMAGTHKSIVNAMQHHPTSVTVQRQAALAIRNIASRSPELRSMILKDCDTEVTLRTISAKSLQCQDEVYAALRDLGLESSSIHVHQADDGTITVQNGRPTFGLRNPNFRPDFKASEPSTEK
jgi:hypothetical protein